MVPAFTQHPGEQSHKLSCLHELGRVRWDKIPALVSPNIFSCYPEAAGRQTLCQDTRLDKILCSLL